MKHGGFYGERTAPCRRNAGATTAAALLLGGLILTAGAVQGQTTQQKIDAADWFERPIAQGVTWRYYHFDNLLGGHQNINIIEVDLNDPNVSFNIPYRVPPPNPSYQQLHTMVTQQYPNAVAAVNGSAYLISGDGSPNTYLRSNSTTIIPEAQTATSIWLRGALGVLPNGKATVLTSRPTAAGGWANEPDHRDLLASGPNLLAGGVSQAGALPTTGTHCDRHPRTILASTADNRLMMVTVDGRQTFAAGLTCLEMIELMQALGAHNAVSFDGGGSTTMFVKGEPGYANTGVVNWFSDSIIRSVADGIAVTSTAATPLAWDGRATNVTAPAVARTNDPITVTATLTNLGSETWTSANVSVVPSRAFGRTSTFVPGQATFWSMSPATVAPGQSTTLTLNLMAPVVASDTVYREHFALWHTSNGYFGPPDNAIFFSMTVRPEIVGAPPAFVVQGTPTGPNNHWYSEPTGGWSNSTVGFTAAGVSNGGSQRYCGAGTANRYAEFKPEFDVAGTYKVEVSFPPSSNNINAVTYTVNHMDGVHTQVISQATGANTWISLGEFPFSTATTGKAGVHSVTVGNASVTAPPADGNRFYSGAVRFDYVGPLADVPEWNLY